jgi:hypothetical protein
MSLWKKLLIIGVILIMLGGFAGFTDVLPNVAWNSGKMAMQLPDADQPNVAWNSGKMAMQLPDADQPNVAWNSGGMAWVPFPGFKPGLKFPGGPIPCVAWNS